MSDPIALVLDAFAARLGELRRRKPTRIRNALRRLVLPDSGAHCWHCGQPAKHVEALISERAGGTIRLENLVAACGPCRRTRGDLDPLEFAELRGSVLTDRQVQQRLIALSASSESEGNSRFPRKIDVRLKAAWPEKWAHPRVPLLLQEAEAAVLVGLLQKNNGPSAAICLLAIRAAGGHRIAPDIVQIDPQLWVAVRPELSAQHALFFSA